MTGTNTPVSLTLRVLVYPAPADLSARAFSFTQWSQDAPGGTYPEHMIFLQSAMDDPGVYDDLLYAYNLTADQYNDVDLLNIGFPLPKYIPYTDKRSGRAGNQFHQYRPWSGSGRRPGFP